MSEGSWIKWVKKFLIVEWLGYNALLAIALYVTSSGFDEADILTIAFVAAVSTLAGIYTFFVVKKEIED